MHDTLKREREICDLCIQALRALEIGDVRADKVDGPREAMIYLKGPWGTKKYVGAVKTRIAPEALGLITKQVEFLHPKTHTVILTEFVPPKLYEGLKQNKVEFIDTAGNAYLNNPPLYVEITGRKRKQVRAGRPVRAFRPAGLKLVFIFLKKPGLLGAPYRELANRAGIAVGAVGVILRDLEHLGFIRRRARGELQLANWPELLERWEMGYTELLRPKLALGTFKAVGRTLEDMVPQVQNWKEDGCLIGGELAAALLTKQLRPETTILHTADDLEPTLLALKLLPDPEGNVEILRTFGNENKYEMHRGIADPVLVHVELLRQAGDRTREIAKLILEDHIAQRFQ